MSDRLEQAKAALTAAKGAHAVAMVNADMTPDSEDARRELREAVRAGRAALKEYRAAATAGIAAEIDALAPAAFREE